MAFKYNPFTGNFDLVSGATNATTKVTYEFARTGTIPVDSYLYNNSGGGYLSGPRVGLSSPEIKNVSVSSSASATYDIEIYEYDGTTRTLLTTLNIVAARGADFTPNTSMTQGRELLIKIVNGSPTDVSLTCIIEGAA